VAAALATVACACGDDAPIAGSAPGRPMGVGDVFCDQDVACDGDGVLQWRGTRARSRELDLLLTAALDLRAQMAAEAKALQRQLDRLRAAPMLLRAADEDAGAPGDAGPSLAAGRVPCTRAPEVEAEARRLCEDDGRASGAICDAFAMLHAAMAGRCEPPRVELRGADGSAALEDLRHDALALPFVLARRARARELLSASDALMTAVERGVRNEVAERASDPGLALEQGIRLRCSDGDLQDLQPAMEQARARLQAAAGAVDLWTVAVALEALP
jgi:hypothetical protein